MVHKAAIVKGLPPKPLVCPQSSVKRPSSKPDKKANKVKLKIHSLKGGLAKGGKAKESAAPKPAPKLAPKPAPAPKTKATAPKSLKRRRAELEEEEQEEEEAKPPKKPVSKKARTATPQITKKRDTTTTTSLPASTSTNTKKRRRGQTENDDQLNGNANHKRRRKVEEITSEKPLKPHQVSETVEHAPETHATSKTMKHASQAPADTIAITSAPATITTTAEDPSPIAQPEHPWKDLINDPEADRIPMDNHGGKILKWIFLIQRDEFKLSHGWPAVTLVRRLTDAHVQIRDLSVTSPQISESCIE
ncbi:hypothetical protein AA313_de0207428 [Arthrobotrys entomopaga]|nr:hypothetical protein AA313_de0207428 [Arthrobotrys entomopaga]